MSVGVFCWENFEHLCSGSANDRRSASTATPAATAAASGGASATLVCLRSIRHGFCAEKSLIIIGLHLYRFSSQ